MKKIIVLLMFLFVITGCNEIKFTGNQMEYNENVYKKFSDQYFDFTNNSKNKNELVVYYKQEVIKTNSKGEEVKELESNIKVNHSPIYIEINEDSQYGNSKKILNEENGKVFLYKKKYINTDEILKSYYKSIDAFTGDYVNEDGVLEFRSLNNIYYFDSQNGIATNKRNSYTFTQSYVEGINDKEFQNLYNIAHSNYIFVSHQTVSDLKTTINFERKSFEITNEITLDIAETLDVHFTISVKTTNKYVIEGFQKNMYTDFTYLHPTKIQDVIEYSNISEKIRTTDTINYFKFKLEKGYYYLENNNSSLFFTVYDNNYNQINYSENINDQYSGSQYKLENIINIEESGDYYFRIHSGSIINFKIIKID